MRSASCGLASRSQRLGGNTVGYIVEPLRHHLVVISEHPLLQYITMQLRNSVDHVAAHNCQPGHVDCSLSGAGDDAHPFLPAGIVVEPLGHLNQEPSVYSLMIWR